MSSIRRGILASIGATVLALGAAGAMLPAAAQAATKGCDTIIQSFCVTGIDVQTTEGATAHLVAAATGLAPPSEQNEPATATISWGDGASSRQAITNYSSPSFITGFHAYREPGSYHVTVTVEQEFDICLVTCQPAYDRTATGTSVATVTDAPLSASPVVIPALVDQQFSGVVATFTDPGHDALDSYSARINWGDGSFVTAGRVSQNGDGSFSVTGTHIYQSNGEYNVRVTIADADGATTSVISDAQVANT